MNDKIQDELEDDLREEYDLSQLKNPVRGKYYQQYREGHSVTIYHEDGTKTVEHFPPRNDVIILDPDVKKYFPRRSLIIPRNSSRKQSSSQVWADNQQTIALLHPNNPRSPSQLSHFSNPNS